MRRVVKAENLECVGRLHGGALYFCLFTKWQSPEDNQLNVHDGGRKLKCTNAKIHKKWQTIGFLVIIFCFHRDVYIYLVCF